MVRIATINGKNVLDVNQPNALEAAAQNTEAPTDPSFYSFWPSPNPKEDAIVGDDDWTNDYLLDTHYEIEDNCLESREPVLSLSKQKIIECNFENSLLQQEITVFDLMGQPRYREFRAFLLEIQNSEYILLETTGAMLEGWLPAKFHHWPLFYIKLPREWKHDIQRLSESPKFSVHLLRNERNPWEIVVRASIISDDKGSERPSEARRIDINSAQVARAFMPSVGAVLVCFECMGKLRLTLYPVDDDLETELQCALLSSSCDPLFDATLEEVTQMRLDIERGRKLGDRDSILFDVVQSP